MEQKREKKYIVGSILCGLLTALGIVALIMSMLSGGNGLWFFCDCVQILLLLLIIFYAFVGYKKPHGNLLKYIFLLHAVTCLFVLKGMAQIGNEGIANLLMMIRFGLLCYIAGRLVKVKENLILMILVTVCLVVGDLPGIIAGEVTIGIASGFIIWLDICVAYFLRYKQHREAGLEDAPKSK